MARDYKKEYKYHGTPEQIKRRSSRNKARRKMIKAGRARVGDGKDVGHKNNQVFDNSLDNLSLMSKSTNRREPRLRKRKRK